MIWGHHLVGRECDAVWFVRDYVSIHLDGYLIHCTGVLGITKDGLAYTFPGSGSRDALCTLIGQTTMRVASDGDTYLDAIFSNDAVLRVRQHPDQPEWEVFNAVEVSF